MEDIASSRLGLELFAALKSSARSVAATRYLKWGGWTQLQGENDSLQNNG